MDSSIKKGMSKRDTALTYRTLLCSCLCLHSNTQEEYISYLLFTL